MTENNRDQNLDNLAPMQTQSSTISGTSVVLNPLTNRIRSLIDFSTDHPNEFQHHTLASVGVWHSAAPPSRFTFALQPAFTPQPRLWILRTPRPKLPPSRFFAITGEMRNIIYEFVLEDCERVIGYSWLLPFTDDQSGEYEEERAEFYGKMGFLRRIQWSRLPSYGKHWEFGLMLVCRQFRDEVRGLVYSRLAFHIGLVGQGVQVSGVRKPLFWSIVRHLLIDIDLRPHSFSSDSEMKDFIRPLVDEFETVTFYDQSHLSNDASLPELLGAKSGLQKLVDMWEEMGTKGISRTYETYREVFAEKGRNDGLLFAYDGVTISTGVRMEKCKRSVGRSCRSYLRAERQVKSGVIVGSWERWERGEELRPAGDASAIE